MNDAITMVTGQLPPGQVPPGQLPPRTTVIIENRFKN